MGEFTYKLGQRTARAPKIRKLGAIKMGMEQTPVMFKGEPVIVESVGHVGDTIRVRNLKTGEVSQDICKGYYFVSAFAEGENLYAFATSARDDKPLTIYQTEDASSWHDPRGGSYVRMFKTTDLIHWEQKNILHCPDLQLWNTSVCKGSDRYVMAIEVRENDGYSVPQVGQDFTVFFAESTDLENWTMMPYDCSYTPKRYNACPALRYANGYYYMICLEALPCARYAPYIYRTQNFTDWEVGFHNPIMMYSDEDRIPHASASFTPEELDVLENGLNINNSDVDLFEFEGKTHIYYASGDQMTYSFLCEAVYDGPPEAFLEAFFKTAD